MTGPVVCGVDFSEDSRRALHWARLFAERFSQPLIVVHAVEQLLANAAEMKYGPGAIEETLRPELTRFVSQSIGEGAEIQVEFGVGEPDGILRGTALSTNASLIVLGTQGLGHAGRFWFGSTTTRVLREATRPVLAVPPPVAARADAAPRIDSIIVGTDFGPASRAAVAIAEALGKAFDVPLTALHAVPEVSAPSPWSDAVTHAVETGVREARKQMADTIPAHWASEVRTGSAAGVLVDAAAGSHALIVVGLDGASPAKRPGSTAYRVLLDADAPVLAVPAAPGA